MQMMDLLVKVAASNKLSPASHTLLIYGEDNRPVQYLASSTVYSVGHTTLHLVSKKQETKRPAPTKDKPFEVKLNNIFHSTGKAILTISFGFYWKCVALLMFDLPVQHSHCFFLFIMCFMYSLEH